MRARLLAAPIAAGAAVALLGAPPSSARRAAPADPRVVIAFSGSFSAISDSTAPAAQEAGRSWSERFTWNLELGQLVGRKIGPGFPALHLSDLRAALTRRQSLLTNLSRWLGGSGSVSVVDTRGNCNAPLRRLTRASAEVDAVRGRRLVVAVDFDELYDLGSLGCAGSFAPVTFVGGSVKPSGTWSWSPEIPGLFTSVATEVLTRKTTAYFTIDVDRPAGTQTLRYRYRYEPRTPGDHTSTIVWEGTVRVRLAAP